MQSIPYILASLILTAWVIGAAILSVQNATPVSIKFLVFQSIQMPVGIVLAFSVGVGIIAAILIQLSNNVSTESAPRRSRNDLEDDN